MSNWDNMLQWEVVLPPSRPTEEELNRIVKEISHYDKKLPVAVLGSTPEFREILHRLNFSNSTFPADIRKQRLYKLGL